MQKDVIYIEPEEDITDILGRIKQSSQRIVALVPPKKIGVLRSAVNVKLIAKLAKTEEKAVVFVTADPSLMKLAALQGIPVAKTLQSRPIIPALEPASPEKSDIEIKEVKVASKPAKTQAAPAKPKGKPSSSSDEIDLDEETIKQPSKSKKSKIPDFTKKRKFIIAGAIGGVLLVVFAVWALIFAPAVDITVAVRTTSNNFSENITFTKDQNAINSKKGVFMLEEQKYEKKSSTEFVATGKKDVGDKASGELTVFAIFDLDAGKPVSTTIPAGSGFSYAGMNFSTNSGLTISWDGDNLKQCEGSRKKGCVRSGKVRVTATAPGEKYNIGRHSQNEWSSSLGGVGAYNNDPFSGGTSKMVTIVQQSDIDKAKEKLTSEGKSAGKKKLFKKIPKNLVAIESTLKHTVGDPVSTPALGEQVADGSKVKLESTTSFTVFTVDKAHIEEFIKFKSSKKLAPDQKNYSIGEPFFERFTEGNPATAKLKATTQSGPKVTEKEVLEKSLGRKNGEVQSLIKSINGVSTVSIKPSFFWVRSVPNDANRVKVEIKVEK